MEKLAYDAKHYGIFINSSCAHLIASDGHLMHAVVDAPQHGQHGVQGQLEIVLTTDIFGRAALAVLHQILLMDKRNATQKNILNDHRQWKSDEKNENMRI